MLNLQNLDNEEKLDYDKKNLYYKKIVKPSNEELNSHIKFLKNNLKKNFFN